MNRLLAALAMIPVLSTIAGADELKVISAGAVAPGVGRHFGNAPLPVINSRRGSAYLLKNGGFVAMRLPTVYK